MTRYPSDYPGKRSLSETEARRVLQSGPDPTWFEPWAERGVNLSNATSHPYGYFHVYSVAGSFQYDFAAWPTEEGLCWGLEALWNHHTGRGLQEERSYPRCEECQSVVYFTADEPLRMRLVIEQDDEDEDEDGEEEADQ
ncbi:hypothetical protein ARHIZOSPH14_27450 [Agromyces rhizosphaerae]|uniref:Uncharacterized protein n=1 Tax=Agromyces rhizosphaerae TaxID=88374 RepID=A0A9W6FST3_9MICO|nr:hypothetical protein [Agromyces rhizosphaerae]GLI28503.1 hypothetical protein ARHIZOSPH14_27450 [Agromyces rhizosphaerae]